MTERRGIAWLHHWLTQHSLQDPPPELMRGYTQQVMRRVRHPEGAFASLAQWWVLPRLAVAAGMFAVCVLMFIAVSGRQTAVAPARPLMLAQDPTVNEEARIEEDLALIEEVGADADEVETWLAPDARVTDEELLEELRQLEVLEAPQVAGRGAS